MGFPGVSVYGKKGLPAGGSWCWGGEVGGGNDGTPYVGNRRSMPPGIVLVFRAGLNPLAIGIYVGICGCVGTEYDGGPDEENGRRFTTPGTVEGSIGRVRGNTEADHRCGVLTPTKLTSPNPCRSVMGRSSREDVARCMVRRGAALGWLSAGMVGLSRCVV